MLGWGSSLLLLENSIGTVYTDSSTGERGDYSANLTKDVSLLALLPLSRVERELPRTSLYLSRHDVVEHTDRTVHIDRTTTARRVDGANGETQTPVSGAGRHI